MTDYVNQIIAKQLKDLRSQQGWSLDRTAQATKVSKAMLGQIERGESSPTIATLWKIATGFDVSFSSLLGEIADGKALGGVKTDPEITVKTLFAFSDETRIEIFEITLSNWHEQLSTAHAKGVIEHLHVLEGHLSVLTGDQWQALKPGESVKFAADKDHGYKDLAGFTRYMACIYYPEPKKKSKSNEYL